MRRWWRGRGRRAMDATDAQVLRTLIALTPYAVPELAPLFPAHRRRALAPLLGARVWRLHRRLRPPIPSPRRSS